MNQYLPEDEQFRLSPWISWVVILGFGPAIAFFLAGVCGFPATQETLQVILLIEICLMAAAVILLVMIQAIGPWTDREQEDKRWLRLMKPAPGSLLEELSQRPAEWNGKLDLYLRSMWRDIAGELPQPAPLEVTPSTPLLRPDRTASSSAPVMNRPGRPAPPAFPNPGIRRGPPPRHN